MKAFKHMTALVLALVMAAALAVTAYAATVTVKYREFVYSSQITFRQYDYSRALSRWHWPAVIPAPTTVRRLATGTAAPSSTRKSGRQHRRSFGSLSVSTAAPIPTMIGDTVRSTTAWIPAATPPLSCGTMRSRRRCSRQTRSPALPHTPSYGPM